MRITPARIALVAFATASLAAAPAIAASLQAEARVSMTGIGLEIYDANLFDGRAPSVSFIDDTNPWRTLNDAFVRFENFHQKVSFMWSRGGSSVECNSGRSWRLRSSLTEKSYRLAST